MSGEAHYKAVIEATRVRQRSFAEGHAAGMAAVRAQQFGPTLESIARTRQALAALEAACRQP